MGFASWLVWRQGGLRVQAVPLCLYLLQLAVNLWAWPPIFVGGQRRRYAFVDSAGILHQPPIAVSPLTLTRIRNSCTAWDAPHVVLDEDTPSKASISAQPD